MLGMGQKRTKEYFDIEDLRPPVLALPIITASERELCEVKVTGSRGDIYTVDKIEMSCTCPDWMEDRIRFPRPDVRRACKHVDWQFSPDRFVLRGEKLFGRLVPVPALECRFGGFTINGSLVLFRGEPKRRWYFEVLAEHKGDNSSGDFAHFRTDMYRWFDRPVPKYSEQIKHYLRNWLKHQPEFEEVSPPLPQSVLDRFAERERLEELEKEKCYVCRFQLHFDKKEPEVTSIVCPRCTATNILTKSGRTNTQERLALYRKYDGDLYDKKLLSLQGHIEREFERRCRTYKELQHVGGLTHYEFNNHVMNLESEKERRLWKLRHEKEIELETIRKKERELRRIALERKI